MKNISVPTNLAAISSFEQLLPYLEANLDWPTKQYSFEDLTFEFEPEELGLKDADAAKIKSIHQLRPLKASQPFGIFFVEFENKKLPVVVLRRILSHLALKKRASANKTDTPAWHAQDIIFVSAFGEDNTAQRELAFAHFHQTDGDLPTLRVLGWDGADTPLKLAQVDKDLRTCLRWPDDESDTAQWRAKWSAAFKHRQGYVIRTANELAQTLALFARQIRDAAVTMLEAESERGAFRKLYKGFKTALIHDLTEEAFADTYAQTITYGLLTAAISRTDKAGEEGTAFVADNIADMVPVTNPFLKDMLETFLHTGGRKGGINFDELGIQDVVDLLRDREKTDLAAVLRDFNNKTQGEDPVIHFYEHFLSAYNKKLKIQRGVFYTPQPVVSYIVRSVHELLQTEFGLEDGLASTITWGEMIKRNPDLKLPDISDDPKYPKPVPESEYFVQILDPATGTATFLVEAIDVIYNHLKAKWAKSGLASMPALPADTANCSYKLFTDFWNAYVPQALLPRLHGYELLMAPYAIAHMKIGLKLAETGYRFGTEERVRIYLTNALEPKVKQLPQIGFEALAHEAAAVNEIKWGKRFTVIIGNPPYSASICEPEWLMQLLEEWKKGLNEAKSDLNREEWKFLRLAQYYCTAAGGGIIGFIINRDFLDGIAKRRMREHLGQSFPLCVVVDLNGDVKGNIADENVFEIEQGVAITVLSTNARNPALRFTSRVGTRTTKYTELLALKPLNADLMVVEPTAPYFRWVPLASEGSKCASASYSGWIPLDSVFTLKSSGIQTKNDSICIGWSASEVFDLVEKLAKITAKDACSEFGLKGDGVWSLVAAQADLRQFGVDRKHVRRILYRPFDYRFTYYTHKSSGFLGRPRYDVMRHMLNGSNVGLVFNRQIVGESVSHFGVSRDLICHGTFYLGNKGQDYLAPLYLHTEDLFSSESGVAENFTPEFMAALCLKLGVTVTEVNHEDIFNYIYAVFHSPGYRTRYAEFLKIDFPRLPLTSSIELFRALAALGGELVALHLIESPKLDNPITHWIGDQKQGVEKITYSDDTVWIDKTKSAGFKGVPEAAWAFHIGGYQVCEKWLKDRKGRTLNDDDINHYHKIIIALSETIRLMSEIDIVINTHGGWPGAFTERETTK